MTIEKISYSMSYEMVTTTGLKLWQKLGVEGTLSQNEDPKEGYKALHDLIEETHKEHSQPLSFVADNAPVPEVQVEKEQPKSLLEQIESCTEVKVLESYRLIAKTKPECQEAYDKKLKELKK